MYRVGQYMSIDRVYSCLQPIFKKKVEEKNQLKLFSTKSSETK